MKTISKLLLTTAILATGAMASGDPAPGETVVAAATLSAGMRIAHDATVLVPNNYTVTNSGDVSIDGVTNIYTESGAIDVYGQGSEGTTYGKLVGTTSHVPGTAPATDTEGGTIAGKVARHWTNGGVQWTPKGNSGSDANIFQIGVNGGNDRGFISSALTIAPANLYEVMDAGNKLARLYRSVGSDEKLTNSQTAELTSSAISTSGLEALGASSTSYKGEHALGNHICYDNDATGGPDSVVPNSTFKIDTSIDTSASSNDIIAAKIALDSTNTPTTLQLITGSSNALTFTPAENNSLPANMILGEYTAAVGTQGEDGYVAASSTAGKATFSSDNAFHSASAIGITGTLRAHDGSSLTLGGSTVVPVSAAWTFCGAAALTSTPRLNVTSSITFGAPESVD